MYVCTESSAKQSGPSQSSFGPYNLDGEWPIRRKQEIHQNHPTLPSAPRDRGDG